jgi:hypothetical protein
MVGPLPGRFGLVELTRGDGGASQILPRIRCRTPARRSTARKNRSHPYSEPTRQRTRRSLSRHPALLLPCLVFAAGCGTREVPSTMHAVASADSWSPSPLPRQLVSGIHVHPDLGQVAAAALIGADLGSGLQGRYTTIPGAGDDEYSLAVVSDAARVGPQV